MLTFTSLSRATRNQLLLLFSYLHSIISLLQFTFLRSLLRHRYDVSKSGFFRFSESSVCCQRTKTSCPFITYLVRNAWMESFDDLMSQMDEQRLSEDSGVLCLVRKIFSEAFFCKDDLYQCNILYFILVSHVSFMVFNTPFEKKWVTKEYIIRLLYVCAQFLYVFNLFCIFFTLELSVPINFPISLFFPNTNERNLPIQTIIRIIEKHISLK